MRLFRRFLISVILFAGVVVGGWCVWNWDGGKELRVMLRGKAVPQPDSERYEFLIEELNRWRGDLADDYAKAKTATEKAAVEHDARVILNLLMPELMGCWLGTPYDFNGTAEKPGEGAVACGYFVSTVMRDAGFKVNRYKLAQQPSENIMRTFLPKKACELRVGKDYAAYVDWVETLKDGVYIVGLDTHVGFIVIQKGEMHFIHSSGGKAYSVVDQDRKMAGALKHSRWRMLGALTGSPEALKMWLKGNKIKIRS